jgi:hypothetical protein
MRRGAVVALASLLGGSAVACSALLGLDERTLRPADASTDGTVESGPCDGGFCACHPHDFCEDFDSYKTANELKLRWTNQVGFPPSPTEFNGSVRLDPTTVIPPSVPNALLTRTDLQSKAAIAAAFVQLDGTKLHSETVVGLKLTFQLRVDLIDPQDGSAPIRDSGIREAIGVVELVSSSGAHGVGMLLTEEGGYVGYALNVNDLVNATLAQGVPFSDNRLVSPQPVFFPFTIVIAPRNSIEVGNVGCQQGPVLNLGDAEPDAATGPNPLVIVLIPPLGIGTKVCEILGGELLDPAWVQNPVLALGSVQVGAGSFQAAFDDVVVDFLTK